MAIKAFFSYSHINRDWAGKMKAQLEPYGFDIFLAHENIEPSVEWEAEILKQLNACEVFIALVTESFDESDWTHQEVGIAFGRDPNRPIMVPINAGSNPVGFFKRYQAIKFDPSRVNDPIPRHPLGARRIGSTHLEKVALRVVKIIASRNDSMAEQIRRSLIARVLSVDTFDDAGWLMWSLAELDGLSPDQVNELLKAAAKNDQVYGSSSAYPHIERLIDSHKGDIKKIVLRKLRQARS